MARQAVLGPAAGLDFRGQPGVGPGQFGCALLHPPGQQQPVFLDFGPGFAKPARGFPQPGRHGVKGRAKPAQGIAAGHGHGLVQIAGFHGFQGLAQGVDRPQHEQVEHGV